MISKVFSLEEAVKDVFDGATILVGGFGASGTPHNLVEAISKGPAKDLTLVYSAFSQVLAWGTPTNVKKVISTFPVAALSSWKAGCLAEEIKAGRLEVELVPQGTLAERIRAGGAGIPAFFNPVGVGTIVEEGKKKSSFLGKEYLLEFAIKADFALIKADKADRWGNLTYRMAQRNFNPIMATAADVVIAEVDEIVELGELSPEVIVTPSIYVDRVVKVPKRVIRYGYHEVKD